MLAAIAADHRLRTLVPAGSYSKDHNVIDLTSNDYLDLRHDPVHQAALHEVARDFPFGSGGSRLLGGEHPVFRDFERMVADFADAEDALFFPSGFAANESVATTLGRLPDAAFFSDELNHASIIDGIRASGLEKSRRRIFAHNDLTMLESQLAQTKGLKFIFSESLFSMDGDTPDLNGLQTLADRYGATLVIDEAHAFFCNGPEGRGLCPGTGIRHREAIRILTCGKGMSLQGALVCSPSWFRDLLINVARPFIYTTGPSPVLAAAGVATMQRSAALQEKRDHLAFVSRRLRVTLNGLGFSTARAGHHILPVICGENSKALALSAFLAERGISSRAIRPPTVPAGTARVRLSLHAGIAEPDLARIESVFRDFAP
jgi:8-amino-7-oxononanoate synthase